MIWCNLWLMFQILLCLFVILLAMPLCGMESQAADLTTFELTDDSPNIGRNCGMTAD